jgi:hypothetical protein
MDARRKRKNQRLIDPEATDLGSEVDEHMESFFLFSRSVYSLELQTWKGRGWLPGGKHS